MPPRLLSVPLCFVYGPHIPIRCTSKFHTSSPWHADNSDYYDTLQVPHNASAATIKKQFYALSKLHHPDHNPSDPLASTRFVAISEAYATLGSPSKRERYDRDVLRTSAPSAPPHRQGSHHSSSTPFGSRPASGLSKRRTRFHGPPPSFYRSGGWGAHGAKRAAEQGGGAGPSESASGAASGQGNPGYAFRGGATRQGGGFSPGQGPPEYTAWSDVPHFNQEGHRWTQEQQELRRRRRMDAESLDADRAAPGMLFNFLLISGVVGFASLMNMMWQTGVRDGGRRDDG
ncbi:hypothetical protein MMC13_005349 [Lambiella insularis]|nr:hypothetical protein [Lambiella insularis]